MNTEESVMSQPASFLKDEEASVVSFTSILGAAAVVTFLGALQFTGVQVLRIVEPILSIPERLIN